MVLSPRLSFKGYNFGTALYRNKDTIKAIVAILATLNIATGIDWKVVTTSLIGAVGVLAGKLVLDAVDYFFTEVEI